MSLEGKHIGEFEILEKLGQGGMGAVYKAQQTSLRRTVALKTLQSSLAGDADFISRFRQEAFAAAALNHSNLVQVISAGESDGVHWFAMEYVEGESAQARLNRQGRLDPVESVAIVTHVATALGYGWRKAGLIHRDIKPDNIFLSGDGEVKLGDLGLAKSAGQAPGLTSTGAIMGTPYYISPEQAEGIKAVDFRSDIYSLGCTLYHLLCGRPPYEGDSAVVVMMKHMREPAPDLRAAWPECPMELAATVEKMIQKEPDYRQQSHEELIADLHNAYEVISGARESSATPTTQNTATGKRSAAPMAWIVSAVAVAAVIAALLYFSPWKDARTRPELRGNQPIAQKSPSIAMPAQESTPGPRVERTIAVATPSQPDATPAPTTPAPNPQPLVSSAPEPSTPGPSTPVQSAAPPKLPTEVEKWLAQVDGPQEGTFQKQVEKPFEAGVADLRARYLAALDADIAKASSDGQLADALIWRTERQAFEKEQNVAQDEASTPGGVKTLREAFRQQLARLDQNRIAKATALLGPYDAILAKNQTLLTQHQHLDDALLLKNKRDEIALTWLGPSPIITVSAADPPDSPKPTSTPPAGKGEPSDPENKVTNASISWSNPVSSQSGPNRILEVKLSPAPPAKLRLGQRVNLTYNYQTNSREGIGISVMPLMDTPQGLRPPMSVGTGGSAIIPDRARANHGSATYYFIVNQPAHTQEVGLTMRSQATHKVLAYLTIHADYQFEGAPASEPASPEGPATADPNSAAKELPFVNSLGMKFVPVPIPRQPKGPEPAKSPEPVERVEGKVLFCIWETRVQDYRLFVQETKNEWPAPGFPQGDTEPAVNVSWNDAQAFCAWLTKRERQAGKIAGNAAYRLPSDHEWSCAVGIGDREDPATTPLEKTRKIADEYPWGSAWPPPTGAGNFSGEEAVGHETNPRQKILPGYRDAFPQTAPVGSFVANAFGLFDLAGNAMEWCEDWFDAQKIRRVIRSSSFIDGDRSLLLSSIRSSDTPTVRGPIHGFRCVLAAPGG